MVKTNLFRYIYSLLHTLMVLQLANDENVLAFFPEYLLDSVHVSSLADEGGKHHVYALLHAKLKVLNVLLRHSGQVHFSAREVHSLLAAQDASVFNLAVQEIRTWKIIVLIE